MAAGLHPREMVKLLLQGVAPPRPLLLPIVFSLGAKIENLPLAAFLENPAKICSALRQIRGYVGTDGVSCYFDPYLEAEMLGAQVRRGSDGTAEISWSGDAASGALLEGLVSVEDAMHSPRVGVAVDVIGRMKTILRDEPLLMAGVTGPLTLAARLTQRNLEGPLQVQDLPPHAVELSNGVFAGLARTLAEAGANAVLIQEDVEPLFSEDTRAAWIMEIASACNVIRFYEALPVLLLNNGCWLSDDFLWMFRHRWNCVVSPLVKENDAARANLHGGSTVGVALASSLFSGAAPRSVGAHPWLLETLQTIQPAVITTAGDVPLTVDVKLLASTLGTASRP
jgi:hypothetical protein